MFQDEPPPPEEFRDPPNQIDNPLYHVYETVKQHGRSTSPKQNKTAPCSPQRTKHNKDNNYGINTGSRQDICMDCYQEGKDLLRSTQDDFLNFYKYKEEFKRQMRFAGKIYRFLLFLHIIFSLL